ncbi:Uncharacterised protein [Chryseobacterium nakagawai]|uniref:Uncharacterized protein n=1 Tax=Chryseobacterium nakagawai TaxID=1241982 RepID=A0AAD1DRZ1_CHRNA|nr:hypothetical protein [Chryseobacterium nakagawai]AZA92343.1 hypothetical protein EG343_17845 [Chryseobacterium nakagawai]VEH18902.1 Uncharacterised protein [Chryseobacterium nakagawai]
MITYMTLPDDTLEKLASDLKVENPTYLKDFHNKHCAVYDKLAEPVKIKPGTLLLIPFGEEIHKLNQEINKNGDSLYYHPPHGKIPFPIPLLSGVYTVIHQKLENGTIQNSYSYQIELKYLRAEQDDHSFSLHIFGSHKNGAESDNKISSLSKACAAILFPVEIKIGKTGNVTETKFLHSGTVINNELDDLKKYFTDDLSASYIEQVKKVSEDHNQILRNTKQTLPVQFLFGSFYRAKYKDWTDSDLYHEFIPWLPNAAPIRFELYNRIFPKDRDNDIIKIKQFGKSCDYRNLNQLYNKDYEYREQSPINHYSVVCRHEAEYILDLTNLMVQKVTAHFEIKIGDVTEQDIFSLEKQLK